MILLRFVKSIQKLYILYFMNVLYLNSFGKTLKTSGLYSQANVENKNSKVWIIYRTSWPKI